MWAATIAILAAVISLWVIWRKKKLTVLKRMGIPGPEPSFLFGNIGEMMKRNPVECHKEWIEKYGKVVGYYFGTQPIILVAEPNMLKKILVSDFHKFMNRPNIFRVGEAKPTKNDGFPDHLINNRDKRWKEVRSMLTPTFTTSKLKMMVRTVEDSIDTFLEKVDVKARSGESFNMHDYYRGLTMDVIGRTAFGVKSDCQRNPNDPFFKSVKLFISGDVQTFLSVLAFSFPEFQLFFRAYRWVSAWFENKGKHPVAVVRESVDSIIKSRRENSANRRQDLLQTMIDAQISSDFSNVTDKDLTAGDDEQADRRTEDGNINAVQKSGKLTRTMNNDEIVDNAALFFLAGYETTSTALAFTTHLLIYHQDVQEKVRQEVKELFEREGKLDYGSVQQLQYMDQVINESLRMYPPVYSFVNREAGENIQIENLRVTKGMSIQVPVYYLQHDPNVWTDPEKFDPDRFSPENKKKHAPMMFQAFGSGPRNCIGMRFAQMEIKLTLAKMLHNYKLVTCKETDKRNVSLKVAPALMRPAKGIYVKAVAI